MDWPGSSGRAGRCPRSCPARPTSFLLLRRFLCSFSCHSSPFFWELSFCALTPPGAAWPCARSCCWVVAFCRPLPTHAREMLLAPVVLPPSLVLPAGVRSGLGAFPSATGSTAMSVQGMHFSQRPQLGLAGLWRAGRARNVYSLAWSGPLKVTVGFLHSRSVGGSGILQHHLINKTGKGQN